MIPGVHHVAVICSVHEPALHDPDDLPLALYDRDGADGGSIAFGY